MKAPSVFRELIKNSRRVIGVVWRMDKKLLSTSLFLIVLGGVFPVAVSYTMKIVIDRITIAQSLGGIVTLTLIGIFAFRYVVDALWDIENTFNVEYIERLLRVQIENQLIMDFTKKMSELDMGHFENPETQNLIQKARFAYPWRITNFSQALFYVAVAVSAYVGSFIALLSYGAWIPIAISLVAFPRFYIKNKSMKLEWLRFNQNIIENKELVYLRGTLEDSSSIKEIRVAQAGQSLLKRIDGLQQYLYKMLRDSMSKYYLPFAGMITLESAAMFGILYTFLPKVVAGTLTLGTFIFISQMLDRISTNTSQIGTHLSRLFEQNLYVGYFFDTLELPKLIRERFPGTELGPAHPPTIEFRNVGFCYEGDRVALRDVSFKMKAGEHLAIVGPNGAGKTTLVKLLLRFYDPTSGGIYIDDTDLRDISRSEWYRYVGVLFQDFVRFSLKIKDNILLGNGEVIDESRMQYAAKNSGAHEFIERLPNKYEQRLGKRFEDSTELSQGQWQKLALARAFYESPPVLILDEPTAAVDSDAEEEIFNNLGKEYKDKSLILISHRFSTVRDADRIIVMREGTIAEMGTHHELMKLNGTYASMFQKQAKGYIE